MQIPDTLASDVGSRLARVTAYDRLMTPPIIYVTSSMIEPSRF